MSHTQLYVAVFLCIGLGCARTLSQVSTNPMPTGFPVVTLDGRLLADPFSSSTTGVSLVELSKAPCCDICDAVFRCMLTNRDVSATPVTVRFLKYGYDKHGNDQPDDSFLKRFENEDPPVRRFSTWSTDPLLRRILEEHYNPAWHSGWRLGRIVDNPYGLKDRPALEVVDPQGQRHFVPPEPADFGGIQYRVRNVTLFGEDTAVVECSVEWRFLAARGYKCLLRKAGQRWRVEFLASTWIS